MNHTTALGSSQSIMTLDSQQRGPLTFATEVPHNGGRGWGWEGDGLDDWKSHLRGKYDTLEYVYSALKYNLCTGASIWTSQILVEEILNIRDQPHEKSMTQQRLFLTFNGQVERFWHTCRHNLLQLLYIAKCT